MRARLSMVSLAAFLVSLAGCGAEPPSPEEATEQAASSVVQSGLTLTHQASMDGSASSIDEECRVNLTLLNNAAFIAERQVRIRRPGVSGSAGACTLRHDAAVPANRVWMGDEGFRRVGLTTTSDVSVELDSVVVNTAYSFADDSAARNDGDFYEHIQDPNTANDQVAVLAPHGGNIERNTAEQARVHFFNALPSGSVTSWQGYGYEIDDDTTTPEHWHITSTDINAQNFPKLNQIAGRNFRYAVSFHGFKSATNAGRIFVGGAELPALRREIADEINDALRDNDKTAPDDGVSAQSTSIPSGFQGVGADNFVNWIAQPDRGVQIEQSTEARGLEPTKSNNTDHSAAIAQAVASVYGCLTQPAATTLQASVCTQISSAQGNAYDPVCGRYVADVSIPSDLGSQALLRGTVDTSGLTQSQCGTLEGYASIYHFTGGRWDRLQGGRIQGVWEAATSTCAVQPVDAAFPNTLTVTPPASGADLYRVAVEGRHGATLSTMTQLPAVVSSERLGPQQQCECTSPADCRLYSFGCDGACTCLALAPGEAPPICKNPTSCVISACRNAAATCTAGVCGVGSSSF